jgi:hypothetical protein
LLASLRRHTWACSCFRHHPGLELAAGLRSTDARVKLPCRREDVAPLASRNTPGSSVPGCRSTEKHEALVDRTWLDRPHADCGFSMCIASASFACLGETFAFYCGCSLQPYACACSWRCKQSCTAHSLAFTWSTRISSSVISSNEESVGTFAYSHGVWHSDHASGRIQKSVGGCAGGESTFARYSLGQ